MKVWNSSLAGFLHSIHFLSACHTYKFTRPQGNALINKKLSSGKITLLFYYKILYCLHLYEVLFLKKCAPLSPDIWYLCFAGAVVKVSVCILYGSEGGMNWKKTGAFGSEILEEKEVHCR